jgi:hypothetical protein
MDNTLYLSSVGVIPPLRKRGIAKNMYQIADDNLGFDENTIIKRTCPGRLAPSEFTYTISEMTANHKPVYLNHELSRFDFRKIQGFQNLSRNIKSRMLKKANDKYEETVKDIVKNRRSSFDVFNKEIIALDKAIDKIKDDIAKYFFHIKDENFIFTLHE